jgi:hypothetical protein
MRTVCNAYLGKVSLPATVERAAIHGMGGAHNDELQQKGYPADKFFRVKVYESSILL